MRLGLLGDVHAEDVTLSAVLAAFDRAGVDDVLSVGDIVDGPGDVERTCALLRAREVVAVRGNHDRWIVTDALRSLPHAHRFEALSPESRAWLADLPATRRIDTPRGGLLLCHGVDEDDMQRLLPDDEGYALASNDALQRLIVRADIRYMVGGHTHRRMIRRFGKLTVLNAGTLYRKDDPGAMIVDFGVGAVHLFDVTSEGEVIEAAASPVPLP